MSYMRFISVDIKYTPLSHTNIFNSNFGVCWKTLQIFLIFYFSLFFLLI